jgi:transposase
MNSTTLADRIRPQAVALRRAGKSRREIKEILGVSSNAALNKALAGEPPPTWTRRPRAKDDLRARARQLRQRGWDYDEIASQLRVSKSSVSLWVRDMRRPERLSYEECRKRAAEGVHRYWEVERPARAARREAVRVCAAAEVGALTQREILIAGAIAYWCEGTKWKAHHRQERVEFVNSDPGLIRFFLRFLDAAGVPRGQLGYRVLIHEGADVSAAERFWLTVTDAAPGQFLRSSLKRHNPKTLRKNVGATYHGCLRIDVRGSADLYRRIEGWADGAMNGSARIGEGGNPGFAARSTMSEQPASRREQ